MKKYFFIIMLILLFSGSCIFYVPYTGEKSPPPEPEREYYEQPRQELTPAMDISYFYDYLTPYGVWIFYRPYGYVWIPRNTWYGWRPYTYGRWVWTDYGWTWVSNFRWGWAPFHYGRWAWDRELGWFWIPDVIWGPGWVTWRWSNLYIGWAPLPPEARFIVGVGIRDIAFSIPPSHWIFVEGPYFLDTSLYRYVFPYERNVTVINYTVIKTNIYVRNNRVVNEGIGIDQVRGITKKNISKLELKDAGNAGESRVEYGNVEIFRPTLKESPGAKPKTVINKEEANLTISRTKITRPDERERPATEDQALREIHRREFKLLEESQEKEKKDLEKKMGEEEETAKTSEEKARIDKDFKEKIKKLTESHQEEKAQIQKRHEQEEAETKGKQEKKKEVEKGKIKKKKK